MLVSYLSFRQCPANIVIKKNKEIYKKCMEGSTGTLKMEKNELAIVIYFTNIQLNGGNKNIVQTFRF